MKTPWPWQSIQDGDMAKVIAGVKEHLKKPIEDNTRCTCKSWDDARERGTDHEGYGPAIVEEKDGWSMTWALPRIKYCPWCGKQARLHIHDMDEKQFDEFYKSNPITKEEMENWMKVQGVKRWRWSFDNGRQTLASGKVIAMDEEDALKCIKTELSEIHRLMLQSRGNDFSLKFAEVKV